MPKTLGYHVVKTCYGLWLPGDERGSWSEAWDEKIGFVGPHSLHSGDPIRKLMAEQRMAFPPVRMTEPMIAAVVEAIEQCVQRSAGGLSIVAASIDPTHMHLLIPYSGRDIDNITKWIADQTTKAVHRQTNHAGSLWCKGKWCCFVFDEPYWQSAKTYIERHNLRHGLPRTPYTFIQ